jgi:hypothetical protein
MGKFNMTLLGDFSAILYDEEPLTPEEYMKGVDKKILLRLASFMNGLDVNSSKFYDWKEFLNMWFRKENFEFKNKIWLRCVDLEIKYKAIVSLISPAASLKFFEAAFSIPKSEILQDPTTSEINLFKAYLLFVSETTSKETVSAEYLESLSGEYRIASTLLSQMYPLSDFTNYDLGNVFVTQLMKANFLFEFLESNKEAKYLIEAFYAKFDIDDWRQYFQYIIPLIEAHSKHTSEGWTEVRVGRDENFEKNCLFLESLTLTDFGEELTPDFKQMRGNPIYKVEDGRYVIISPLFVVEKIFKGLYFKLREIHEVIPKQEKTIKNLRSFYTTNFSENYLLYKILEYIYCDTPYVKYTGEKLAYEGHVGAPDYYLRNGNHLFVFENKDVFINAEIKQSYDFRIVEEELKKKFYYENKEGKIVPRATLQLISNIEKALLKQNSFDLNYKPNSLRIYPILILHDSSFNCPGLNAVINEWFKIELAKLDTRGINTSGVKPITIINIDTLILYADFLKLKRGTLKDLINSYIRFGIFNEKGKYKDFEEYKQAYGKSLLSFSFFIDEHTDSGFHKIPSSLRQKTMKGIFPK